MCTRNGQNYFCSISDITESFVRADILEKVGGKHRTAMQDLSVSGASEE